MYVMCVSNSLALSWRMKWKVAFSCEFETENSTLHVFSPTGVKKNYCLRSMKFETHVECIRKEYTLTYEISLDSSNTIKYFELQLNFFIRQKSILYLHFSRCIAAKAIMYLQIVFTENMHKVVSLQKIFGLTEKLSSLPVVTLVLARKQLSI